MNTGQMLLVVGAIALLSTLIVSVLHTHLLSDQIHEETRLGILAISMCADHLNTLLATPFDALTIGSTTHTIPTPIATFSCSTHVGYIYDTHPDSVVIEATSLKRVWVGLTHLDLPGVVTLQSVVGTP